MTIKFRENAVTAVARDAAGITIVMRETRRVGDATETVRLLDPIRLPYAVLSDAVRAEAMGYGLEVRLTRQAAMEIVNGKKPTVQAKWEAIKELADHYASGTESWTMASAGPGLSPDVRTLILAVQRVFGLSAETAETQVRAMSPAERAGLRLDPEVKPVLDAIYAEQAAAAGGDAGDLKARLRGLSAGTAGAG